MKISIRRFSETKKDKENLKIAAAGGLAIGGIPLNIISNKNLGGNKKLLIDESENKALTEKLIKESGKKGIQIKTIDHPVLKGNAMYHTEKDVVLLGKGKSKFNQADVLAHELGHAEHYKKRGGSVIGKIAHSGAVRFPGALSMYKLREASVLAGVNGYTLGRKVKDQDGKSTTTDKIRRIAPAAIMAPVLISEAAASRQGLKMLKKAGASKQTMSKARKSLGSALGSYAGLAAVPVGINELGYQLGKKKSSKKEETNNDKKD